MRWLLGLLWIASAWGAGLRAGAARVDITPREPLPMWGYADRHDRLSEGVLDPLHADILVLETGSQRLALVSLDLGRAPKEDTLQRLRARMSKESGITASVLSASHTHHGPVMELSGTGRFAAAGRYYAYFEETVAAGVAEAAKKLEPARLTSAWTRLDGLNRNRHSKLQPELSDRTLGVFRVDSETGRPMALVVNWTAHPTSLPSSLLKYSADFVGVMKSALREATGAPVLFLQGASGDQSALRAEGQDYQGYGRALAAEVTKLQADLKPVAVADEWNVREERLQFRSRIDFASPLIRQMFSKAFFPELVDGYLEEYKDGVRPRLTVITLGKDLAFVGVSGEFFSAHAMRLRERARVPNLFFAGYANGYHQYFPTIEAVSEGGYGADRQVSPVEVGAGERVMDRALTWLYEMRGLIR